MSTPDGAATATIYSGNQTTVTDPASAQRASVSDALGPLTSVTEAGSLLTSYQYDVLGDLAKVCQGAAFDGSGNCTAAGAQPRTFGYDSVGRLTSARNPESTAATSYTYDANGNLQTKSDASGNTQTRAYDGINRILTRTYSGPNSTPNVTYCYDASPPTGTCASNSAPNGSGLNLNGRLTMVYSSASKTTSGQYDNRGNVLSSTQYTNSGTYPFSYAYNLADARTQVTLPSLRKVSWAYDNLNRVNAVSGAPSGGSTTTYASGMPGMPGIQYTSHGAVKQFTLGNHLVETRSYNLDRLQPTAITLGTSATDSSYLSLGLSYCATGSSCKTNNGNLLSQTINPLNVTQTYGYTETLPGGSTLAINRLSTATEKSGSTTNWQETFSYDSFGNRSVNTSLTSGLSLSALTPTCAASSTDCGSEPFVNAATNRLIGANYGFDSNGNQSLVSPFNVTYDGENRQTGISSQSNGSATYSYDGDGRRVAKTAAGATTVYVYDAAGDLAAEYASQAPSSPCTTCYLTADHLGSTRVMTDGAGVIQARHDYLPFGEEIAAGTGSRSSPPYGGVDNPRQKFTGKERDVETGLDYFGARYLSSAQGRWTSPDWSAAPQPVPYASLGDPQTLNLYGYVRNNPLNKADADGHETQTYNDSGSNSNREARQNAPISSTELRVYEFVAVVGQAVPGLFGKLSAVAAAVLGGAANRAERAEQLRANKEQGKAFEQQQKAKLESAQSEQKGVVEQLTVKTESGVKTRLDFAGKSESGQTVLTEAKSSATAPLTGNQAKAFPEIQQSGATVVGQGKPGFPGGTQIEATEVVVVRPE